MESSSVSPTAGLPLLIIFGGLPATGKTTIARELARWLGATYLRIDSIEQALRDTTPTGQPLNEKDMPSLTRWRKTISALEGQ